MAIELGLLCRILHQSPSEYLGLDYGPLGKLVFDRAIIGATIQKQPRFFLTPGHVIEFLKKMFGGKESEGFSDDGGERLDQIQAMRESAKQMIADGEL